MTVRLSNNQFQMMKHIDQKNGVTIEEAGELNQTTFGSLLGPRGYLHYVRRLRKFILSDKGKEALRMWTQAEIYRKVASMKLTTFFRPLRLVRSA